MRQSRSSYDDDLDEKPADGSGHPIRMGVVVITLIMVVIIAAIIFTTYYTVVPLASTTSSSNTNTTTSIRSTSVANSSATNTKESNSSSSSSSLASSNSSSSSSSATSALQLSSLDLSNNAMAMSVDKSTGLPINRTQSFLPNATAVYSWLNFTNIAANHNVTWIWRSPLNTVYANATSIVPTPSSGTVWTSYQIYSWIYVASRSATSLIGTWQVDVYVDGVIWLIQTFSIQTSYLPHPSTLSDNTVALGVNSSTGFPTYRTQAFLANASAVYSWLNFTDVSPPQHNVTWVWLTPKGNSYSITSYTMPSPGTGNVWASYWLHDTMYIQGHSAAQQKGQWEIEVFVDGVKVLVQTFTIS